MLIRHSILRKLASLVLVTFSFHAKADDDIAAINSPCAEMRYLEEIGAIYEGQMQTLLSTATALNSELRQLTLAAARHAGTPKQDPYLLLMVLAKRRKAEADAKIKANSPRVLRLIKDIGRRRGAMEAQLTKNGKQQATYTSAANDPNTAAMATSFNTKCKITATLADDQVAPCAVEAEAAQKLKAAAQKVKTTGQLQLAAGSNLQKTVLSVSVQVKGNGGATQGVTGNQACGDNGTPDNGQGIAAPTLTSPPYAKIAVQVKNQGTCKAPSGDEAKQHLETKSLIYSVCDIQESDLTSPSTLADTTVDQVAADTDVQVAAMQIAGTDPSKSNQQQKTDIVKRLIGVNDGTIGEKIFKELKKLDKSLKISDSSTGITIDETAGETNFGKALAIFVSQSRKATETLGCKERQTADDDKKPDSADKTEENKEGDNKTNTNTTGSNSFVINKAPLLLAVLFLKLSL
uniref:Variant surface glycoprotein 654 n=1 Tax=Trypanosoma brucei TaxID=5691 RepID=M4TDS6_9TRYP|nr:variant surface glycoprotein 654 [Trypanosoma brucei]